MIRRPSPLLLLYWEFFEGGFSQAARWGDWKAVRRKPWLPLELYDLRTDIGEIRNRAAEHPGVIGEIEARPKAARTESEHWQVPRWRRV